MIMLTVTRSFQITTTSAGPVVAEPGDFIVVKEKGPEYYYIKQHNGKNIFSIWQRKNWILSHCK